VAVEAGLGYQYADLLLSRHREHLTTEDTEEHRGEPAAVSRTGGGARPHTITA